MSSKQRGTMSKHSQGSNNFRFEDKSFNKNGEVSKTNSQDLRTREDILKSKETMAKSKIIQNFAILGVHSICPYTL